MKWPKNISGLPRISFEMSITGLAMPKDYKPTVMGVPVKKGYPDLPEFLYRPNDPQYEWYKKGRDSAFARAEERVAALMRDDLRKYHSWRISPYGRSLRSIKTKILSATKSDESPLGRKIWIGYQPTAGDDRDTVTDRGVTAFMMSTIYGVMPNRIHPPWYGPWAKGKSEVGAIYGSNEYAGFPGGRLGHWAVTKGILPSAQYITKPQQRPRGAKFYSRQKFGGKVYENEYARGPKAGIRRKPGRVSSASTTTVQHYVPYDINHPKTTGRFAKRTIHWNANMFTGQHSLYHGKVVSNKSIALAWKYKGKMLSPKAMESALRKGAKGPRIPMLPEGAKPFPRFGAFAEQEKLKKFGKGAISDKTWENAAKFIAWSLQKKGTQPKPVLREWYDNIILSGMLQERINFEYYDAIEKWNNYALAQWEKHVYNVTRRQFVGGEGLFGGSRFGQGELIGRQARSVVDFTELSSVLFTGKFRGEYKGGKD